MCEQRKRGFTLVELLVVIAIIGTLIGLLLPAVQRARESSRQSTCLSNVRQIALAAAQYETRMRRYPALFDEMPTQMRQSMSGERWTTWAVMLLPDMEKESAFNEYAKGNRPLPGIYVETYLCPSDAEKMRSGSVMSYAANAGGALAARDQKPANGAFLNRIYDPKAAVVDGHWKDGRDHTVVLSERVDNSNYDVMGWNGMVGNPNNVEEDHLDHDVVDEGLDRVWGPAFVWQMSPQPCSYLNGPKCVCTVPDISPGCRMYPQTGRWNSMPCVPCNPQDRSPNSKPSSEHGGGVNIAYSSGRALFLNSNVDYKVYRAMMTLNDKKSDSPDRDELIDDSSLE
jgi:prepilin-type N-terminal cleavage/methylation domain-containing protein